MLSRSAALPLVSIAAACLVTAVASCGENGTDRADAAGGGTRPASTHSSSAGGSLALSSDTKSSGGASQGGSSDQSSGGQSKTGGAGGSSAGGSSSKSGGRSSEASSTVASSSGTSRDASVRVDAPAGGEVGPLACGDKTSNNRLGVYYYTGNSSPQTQDMMINMAVVNFTALTARLSQITVRYWFTDEDAGSPNFLIMNYTPPTVARINTRFLPATPPRIGADTVLEFTFTSSPDAGAWFMETKEFNFNIHKDGYAGTFNLENDYSFDASLNKSYGPNPKITAYIGGELAWGCEPPIDADAGSD